MYEPLELGLLVYVTTKKPEEPKARFPLPELTGRIDGPSTRLVETRARQHGPC